MSYVSLMVAQNKKVFHANGKTKVKTAILLSDKKEVTKKVIT